MKIYFQKSLVASNTLLIFTSIKTNTMEAIKEKRIGKYLIKIFPDDSPMLPNEMDDQDQFLVYDHRQFYVEKEGFEPREIFEYFQKHENKKTYEGYWCFVVYAYIHSGVALSVGGHNFPDARWDVSSTGYVLVKREKGCYSQSKGLKRAKSLIEEWNQCLSGCVYGFNIVEVDEEDEEINDLDSCWGFYGMKECMNEAEDVVNLYIEFDKEQEQVELEKDWKNGLYGDCI